jgi:hypothetical protein
VETGCRGGQGSPRAVAPNKKKREKNGNTRTLRKVLRTYKLRKLRVSEFYANFHYSGGGGGLNNM